MLFRKTLCFISIALLVVAVGCGKKKKPNNTASLLTQSSQAQQTAGKDSADIFDEFYDNSGAKSSTAQSEATFSTASSQTSSSASAPVASAVEFDPNGRYVVQVSCVRSRSLADRVSGQLSEQGFPAYVAEVANPTPDLMGTFYRVRIGGFSGISRAKEFGEGALAAAGYDFWVDNRANDNVGLSGSGLGSSAVESSYGSQPAATSASEWGSSSVAPSSSTDWESAPAATTTPTTTTTEAAASEPPPAATTTPAASEPASSSTPSDAGTATPSSSSGDDWSNDASW